MCGISGIVNGSNKEIIEKLLHRGNDFHETLILNNKFPVLEIGHNRLSIIDLSEEGNQPIESETHVLTYNGEIYNYKDFYLGKGNDAHAILDSLTKHGLRNTLNKLNGMFAFAAYEKKTNQIHLAVDRTAQKPLYYYHDGADVFAFASSPNALLGLKDKWNINQEALQSYWKLGSVCSESSIWDGIKKVQAGHVITYDLDTKDFYNNRYWYPSFIENTNDIDELIIDCIDKVKLADVPVHIFLSGGIDSTLVASRFKGGNAIHMESMETHYAQQVADKFDIKLNVVKTREIDIPKCITDYSLKCGEPSMAGIIPYITAREVDAKVAITANGADELFFGYNRTQQSMTVEQQRNIFREGFDFQFKMDRIDERLSSGRWLELMAYVQHDLNKTLDFASMAHTIEMRAPFLDHRLIEYALSIPQEKHGRKDILKNLLRKLGFSEDFLNRPKQGFSLNIEPKSLEFEKTTAYNWCIDSGYLELKVRSKRDLEYLKMSALGFYYWYETFKNKIA